MPLDRDHVTVASRVMLPTYVLFFGGLGAGYIAGFRIGQNPMLKFANGIMPLQVWGGMFLACGLLMLAAMLNERRELFQFALLICAFSMAIWTGLAIAGVFFQPVTFTAWLWPFLVMRACIATNRSLVKDRREPAGG